MSISTWILSNFQTSVGLGCLVCKQHSKAEAAFARSIEVTPTAAAYSGLGIALVEQKKYDSAIESFHAALVLDPTNPHNLDWLGWALHLNLCPKSPQPGCRHCGGARITK